MKIRRLEKNLYLYALLLVLLLSSSLSLGAFSLEEGEKLQELSQIFTEQETILESLSMDLMELRTGSALLKESQKNLEESLMQASEKQKNLENNLKDLMRDSSVLRTRLTASEKSLSEAEKSFSLYREETEKRIRNLKNTSIALAVLTAVAATVAVTSLVVN